MEMPELPFPGHILGTWQVFLAVLEWPSDKISCIPQQGYLGLPGRNLRISLFPQAVHLVLLGVGGS